MVIFQHSEQTVLDGPLSERDGHANTFVDEFNNTIDEAFRIDTPIKLTQKAIDEGFGAPVKRSPKIGVPSRRNLHIQTEVEVDSVGGGRKVKVYLYTDEENT